MKATITFEYDTDDRDDLRRVIDMQNVANFKASLFEFSEYLRRRLKYDDLSGEMSDALHKIQEEFLEICKSNEANFEE